MYERIWSRKLQQKMRFMRAESRQNLYAIQLRTAPERKLRGWSAPAASSLCKRYESLAAGSEAWVQSHAAIDKQRDSRHVVRLVRGQPDSRPSDVLRYTNAVIGDQFQ